MCFTCIDPRPLMLQYPKTKGQSIGPEDSGEGHLLACGQPKFHYSTHIVSQAPLGVISEYKACSKP